MHRFAAALVLSALVDVAAVEAHEIDAFNANVTDTVDTANGKNVTATRTRSIGASFGYELSDDARLVALAAWDRERRSTPRGVGGVDLPAGRTVGARYVHLFLEFSKQVVPLWSIGLSSGTHTSRGIDDDTASKTTNLTIQAPVGFRFVLSPHCFMSFTAPVLRSNVYQVTETTETRADGSTYKTRSTRKAFTLSTDDASIAQQLQLAIGVKI